MSKDVVISGYSVEQAGGIITADQANTAFNKILLDANYARQHLADAGDWQALTRGLAAFRDMKANLDVLIRAIEDDVAANLPDKKVVLDGVGMIERRSTTSRKWESENLLQHLASRTVQPDGNGMVTSAQLFEFIQLLRAALPFTASTGWRVTALRDNGIDVDNFSDTTYGRQTITIS